MKDNRLLMAFYGDDFTGSTDALEFLGRSGIRTVLFIEAPTAAQLVRYPDLQAIGIAGMSRTMSPDEMEAELRPAFEALAGLNPRHVHYKVCSTFDSSPDIGSIGRAIDIGARVFDTRTVPLLVAAPILGRYCLFGNLFARMGIGSEGNIYRLDRHPSMSRHPVTPAEESDLRLHLARQTDKSIGLFDILELQKYGQERIKPALDGHDILLFDALEQEELKSIGAIIEGMATAGQTLFSAGSSGIEMALGACWQENGTLNRKVVWENTSHKGAVLIASGSCSPVTAAQIGYALKNGFTGIAIDTVSLAVQASVADLNAGSVLLDAAAEKYARQATELIQQGEHPLLHTSLGNDDLRVGETDKLFGEKQFGKAATAQLYGRLLGLIARKTAEKATLRRVVIAGGDTSSYAARAMGIAAVEMIALLSPGAPVCRADAPGSAIDQLELVFKGGQVGKEDFFNNNLI